MRSFYTYCSTSRCLLLGALFGTTRVFSDEALGVKSVFIVPAVTVTHECKSLSTLLVSTAVPFWGQFTLIQVFCPPNATAVRKGSKPPRMGIPRLIVFFFCVVNSVSAQQHAGRERGLSRPRRGCDSGLCMASPNDAVAVAVTVIFFLSPIFFFNFFLPPSEARSRRRQLQTDRQW